MDSRNWKLLVLAPLTLTFLAACADRKKDEPGSPYAGTWLRQSAWADYNESVSDPGSFCPRVYQRPEAHGISRNGSISDVAWHISSGGEVYHWTPSIRFGHPSAKNYAIGNVAADGMFAMQAPVAGRNAYQFQQRIANPYAKVSADAGRLDFWRYDGGSETYVRVQIAELQAYSSRLIKCNSNFRFSSYGYGGGADDYSAGPRGPRIPLQSPYSGSGVPAGPEARPEAAAPGLPAPELPEENGQYPQPDFERPPVTGSRPTTGSPFAKNFEFEPLPALPERRR